MLMPDRKTPKKSGFGVLMLFGLLIGLIVGLALGQPSAGVVLGFVLGAAAALLLGLRRR